MIVTLAVPVGTDGPTVRVRVLCEVVLEGLKEYETPWGKPLMEKETLPEKFPAAFTLMVVDPLAFCCNATAAGFAESVIPACCRMFAEVPPPQPLAIASRTKMDENAPTAENLEVPATTCTDFINITHSYD